VHAGLRGGSATQVFIEGLAGKAFPEANFKDILKHFDAYKAAAEKLIQSHYCYRYTDGKMDWDANANAYNFRHQEASKNFVSEAYKLYNNEPTSSGLIIDAGKLFNEVRRGQKYHDLSTSVPFWISPVAVTERSFLNVRLLTENTLLQYEAALQVWVRAEAAKAANFKTAQNKDEFAAADVYDDLIAKGKFVGAPKPNSTLSDLVDQCVKLELSKDPAKKIKYKAIVKFAEIKYGPTALVDEFIAQDKKQFNTRFVDKAYGKYKRAFFKAFLVIAGLALIGCSVVAAVASFGIGSPAAFFGATLGAGIIAEALGFGMITRDRYHFSFNRKKAELPNFIPGVGQEKKMPEELPPSNKTKMLLKVFGGAKK
jgi:hypothetical protein